MTEIEQLRQDIEKLEAAQNLIADGDGNGSWLLHDNIVERKKQLAKLEAEAADPWRRVKEQVKHLSGDGRFDIYNYANRLENRIAELEAELARTKEAHETVGEAYDCKREDNKDLRRTVKKLESELAKRPVVWCVRHNGNILKQSASPSGGVWDCYHFTGLFPTRLDAAKLMRGEPEPYTGEQS